MVERIKRILSGIFYYPFLSSAASDANQAFVRTKEWESICKYIPRGSRFMDVGCGAGYAMLKAQQEMACIVQGIDPEPGAHGVGRWEDLDDQLDIRQAYAEHIPFDDGTFDVVYSSHVLEHVKDAHGSLSEMKRVLKDDGVLIIGMPTASMACISLVTQLLFTTHVKLLRWICPSLLGWEKISARELFPASHSHPGKTVCFDMKYYRVSNWQRIISSRFRIEGVILPLMYPYPEMRQWFSPFVSKRFSSSVFFICRK